eukprot:5139520-Pleurochrysis_carterae.AAC.4
MFVVYTVQCCTRSLFQDSSDLRDVEHGLERAERLAVAPNRLQVAKSIQFARRRPADQTRLSVQNTRRRVSAWHSAQILLPISMQGCCTRDLRGVDNVSEVIER